MVVIYKERDRLKVSKCLVTTQLSDEYFFPSLLDSTYSKYLVLGRLRHKKVATEVP